MSRQGKANALRPPDDAFINENSNDDELTKQIAGELRNEVYEFDMFIMKDLPNLFTFLFV